MQQIGRNLARVLGLATSLGVGAATSGFAVERVLASIPVTPLQFPVITNVEATPCTDADRVKALLVRQVVSPVRWQESVQELARLGCTTAVEVGPGRVLSGLVRRIAPQIHCTPAEDVTALRDVAGAA